MINRVKYNGGGGGGGWQSAIHFELACGEKSDLTFKECLPLQHLL